jgi:uncharacterized cofD-like protein
MKKIVVIGGGSGLATLLRGIRDLPVDITAIVTMTDDGASSGRLRRDFGILPPGDIRKCITALSSDEAKLTELFQYRFSNGFGLKGHSLGNLIISALREMTGNFELAIEEISTILNIKGRVIPATLDDINLAAKYDDGHRVVGESSIAKYGYKHRIEKVYLTKKPKTNPRAISAISDADIILVGPGSLYTSVIPNFLQDRLLNAYVQSKARKIYICNVSTERGETTGFDAENHVKVLEGYGVRADFVMVNNRDFSGEVGDGYISKVTYSGNDPKYRSSDIVDLKKPLYHDSFKLSREVSRIIAE